MRKILRAIAWIVAVLLAADVLFLAFGRPSRVAVGYASHLLCSETFVSGLDPEKVFAERVLATPGVGLLRYGLWRDVDRERREVTVSYLGFLQRRSVYREGLGCLLLRDGEHVEHSPSPAPQNAPPSVEPVRSSNPRIEAALDRAFAEWTPPTRQTKAVVVMHDGRIVAERYAAGYGVDTPLLSWSAAKSVTSALLGVLARQGRLSLDQPAPVAPWRKPGDPRSAITIANLLRMNDGLDFSEGKGGWDKVSRMLFMERDMAGFVESAPLEYPPGAHWRYCSGGDDRCCRGSSATPSAARRRTSSASPIASCSVPWA